MTILDRHIGRAIAFSTVLVLGVLLSLFTFYYLRRGDRRFGQ